MCPTDELQIVQVQKLARYSLAKEPAGTARTGLPSVHVVGVRPNEIAEGTLVRNFLVPFDCSHLVHHDDVRRESAVDAHDLVVDDGGDGEKIEYLTAVAPRVRVAVLVLTFICEQLSVSVGTWYSFGKTREA